MEMGERIRQLRKSKNLTQEELGKYIGVQKDAIKKYEKGEVTNMKRNTIKTLSRLFKVTPSYLMCLEDEEKEFLPYTSINLEGLDSEDIEKINEFIDMYRAAKKNKQSQ